ncbi:hypothetical protein V6N13_128445 [Hibiscus sabdariffa]|uniref:Uncharacterized protein n=1 Tax=Hibiscus sabdariffa TaxID=183260 RepID=A0ABR2P1B2_9ROSI
MTISVVFHFTWIDFSWWLVVENATTAKHAGAWFVCCVLPEAALHRDTKKRAKDSGLIDTVEFKTGDPIEILLSCEKIDFTLVDCKNCDHPKLFKTTNIDPEKAVMVANNLAGDKEGLGIYIIGMEITTTPEKEQFRRGRVVLLKSKWIVEVDEEL